MGGRTTELAPVAIAALTLGLGCGGKSGAPPTPPMDASACGPGTLRLSALGGPGDDRVAALAGAGADVVVAGWFDGATLSAGGSTVEGRGGRDAFVARLDTSGGGWLRALGGPGNDAASAVATDGEGNLYLAGRFERHLEIDGRAIDAAGASDAFVLKLDPRGQALWLRRLGGSGVDYATALAVTGTGEVALGLWFQGTVDLGAGPVTALAGSWDGGLVLLSPAGEHRWSKRIGGGGHDGVTALAATPGGVAVAGLLDGEADFEGRAVSAPGLTGVFVAHYAAAGSLDWARGFGGAGWNGAGRLVADATGALTVAGTFEKISFGPTTLAGRCSGSIACSDAFVARLSPAGEPLWARALATADRDDNLPALASAADGVAVGLLFRDTLDLGGLTVMAPEGAIAVSHLGPAGQPSPPVALAHLDGPVVLAATAGDLVLAGSFYEKFSTPQRSLDSRGGADVFLLRFPAAPLSCLAGVGGALAGGPPVARGPLEPCRVGVDTCGSEACPPACPGRDRTVGLCPPPGRPLCQGDFVPASCPGGLTCLRPSCASAAGPGFCLDDDQRARVCGADAGGLFECPASPADRDGGVVP
jgi:hypothetical protein